MIRWDRSPHHVTVSSPNMSLSHSLALFSCSAHRGGKEKYVGSPGTVVTDRGETPCEHWKLGLGPLQKQYVQVLLTTKQAFYTLNYFKGISSKKSIWESRDSIVFLGPIFDWLKKKFLGLKYLKMQTRKKEHWSLNWNSHEVGTALGLYFLEYSFQC